MEPFANNDFPTLGVEEEFHLIDPDTGRLKNCVDAVMSHLDTEMKQRVCYELFNCVIENRTGVYSNSAEIVKNAIDGRLRIAEACKKVNALLVASASHPFADHKKLVVANTDHYREVMVNYGYLARRMTAFGLHIHVGVKSAPAIFYIMNRIRPWIYAMMAMSVNSPLFDGEETGLKSTRTHIFSSLPRTGPPPKFESIEELELYYDTMCKSGDVTTPGELWWCLRPQPVLGTLELRAMDLPTDVHRIGALAAMFQAVVHSLQKDFYAGKPLSECNDDYLMQNRWRACHDGLDAIFVCPVSGQIVPARDYINDILDMVEPAASELDGGRGLESARKIVNEESEADWQIRRLAELDGDMRLLELELASKTLTYNSDEVLAV